MKLRKKRKPMTITRIPQSKAKGICDGCGERGTVLTVDIPTDRDDLLVSQMMELQYSLGHECGCGHQDAREMVNAARLRRGQRQKGQQRTRKPELRKRLLLRRSKKPRLRKTPPS